MGAPVDQVYENVVFTGKHLYNEVHNMSGTKNLCQVFSGSPIFKKKCEKRLIMASPVSSLKKYPQWLA